MTSTIFHKYLPPHFMRRQRYYVQTIKNETEYFGYFMIEQNMPDGIIVYFELENPKPRGDELYQFSVEFYIPDDYDQVSTCLLKDGNGMVITENIDRIKSCSCIIQYPSKDVIVDKFINYCKQNPEMMMKFKCKDGEVETITNLMTSNSSVIETMMKSDFIEGQTKIVEIIDFSSDIIKKMIEFCETNIIDEISEEHYYDLLCLSEKYDMKLLKKYIENIMSRSIRIDNVIHFYASAYANNSDKLKKICIKCAAVNWINIMELSLNDDEVDDVPGDVFKQLWLDVKTCLNNE